MHRLHLPELAAGPKRERLQIEEWLFLQCRELLGELVPTLGWWCALELPCSEVFGGNLSGDVDLLAGPLRFRPPLGALKRLMAEEPPSPAAFPGLRRERTVQRAARAGLVEWPPRLECTAAVEVKSSYFDGAQWKARHSGERQKILGSLQKRRELGVNSVSFMHLGVVRPCSSEDELDARLDEAWKEFQTSCLFDVETFKCHGYGYLVRIMGLAIVGDTWIGREVPDQELERSLPWICRPRPERTLGRFDWQDRLQARLAKVPPPSHIRTFVHRCSHCRGWFQAGSANPEGFRCGCQDVIAPCPRQ